MQAPEPILVERVLAGGRDRALTEAERVAVVRAAAARGLTDARTGELVGLCGRTVWRIRRLNGIASGVPFGSNQHGPPRGLRHLEYR